MAVVVEHVAPMLMAGLTEWSGFVQYVQMQKTECDSKWQHILKYQRIGVYVVDDGPTVANFLDNYDSA